MNNSIKWIANSFFTVGLTGLVACGGTGGFGPDFDKTESQQALTPAAEEASETVRIARDSEGTVVEARDGDEQARIETSSTGDQLIAVQDSRERVEVLIYDAASEGYCQCDAGGRVEVDAQDGDDRAQVIVDGCDVFVDAQSGEDSATVSVRDDALNCGDILEVAYAAEALALAADDVGEALAEVTEACDEMDAAGEQAGLTGDECDPTGGLATDYLGADIQDACDAYADAQDQCREAEDLVEQWYAALSDSSSALDLTLSSMDDDVGVLIQTDEDGDNASVFIGDDF
jgi:hypothetical protein